MENTTQVILFNRKLLYIETKYHSFIFQWKSILYRKNTIQNILFIRKTSYSW